MSKPIPEPDLSQMEGFLRREADKDFEDGPMHGLPASRALPLIAWARTMRDALQVVDEWLREDGSPPQHEPGCGYCDVKRAVSGALKDVEAGTPVGREHPEPRHSGGTAADLPASTTFPDRGLR